MSDPSRIVLTAVIVLAAGATLWFQRSANLHLLAENQVLKAKLSASAATHDAFMRRDRTREIELVRLQKDANELFRLRTSARAMAPEGQASRGDAPVTPAAMSVPRRGEGIPADGKYLATEDLEYVGLETPEDTLRSWKFASTRGDYEQWLTTLGPAELEQELANANSLRDFSTLQAAARDEKGMLLMAQKSVSGDRVELKVRFDREASAVILIVPLVAVGTEWKLGGEFRPYTHGWEMSANP
jgi:hypothetical protein